MSPKWSYKEVYIYEHFGWSDKFECNSSVYYKELTNMLQNLSEMVKPNYCKFGGKQWEFNILVVQYWEYRRRNVLGHHQNNANLKILLMGGGGRLCDSPVYPEVLMDMFQNESKMITFVLSTCLQQHFGHWLCVFVSSEQKCWWFWGSHCKESFDFCISVYLDE